MNTLKNITILLLLCCGIVLHAQEHVYPFVNYTENKLYHATDSSITLGFYKKLDELKQGKRNRVTVMHYGGSHIQAGFWTETLSTNFQALNNYQGGGAFAFPFKLAKTNNPPFYHTFSTAKWRRCRCVNKELCAALGMAGIAVITNDSSGTFGITLDANDHLKNFNQMKVFHNFNPGYQFSISPLVSSQYTQTDFPDEGYTLVQFQVPSDSVVFYFSKKDTLAKDFILYGFSLENNLPGVYFAGMGVNGAASDSYQRCELFEKQIKSMKPDLVIFSLGVNDVQSKGFNNETYVANYDTLIAMVRKSSPDCAILFTTVSDNFVKRKTPNKRSMLAEDAIFQLMEKHKACVWDMFNVMGGYKSIAKWNKAKLAAKDKVHFNAKGYAIIGNLMFEAILKSYKANSSNSN